MDQNVMIDIRSRPPGAAAAGRGEDDIVEACVRAYEDVLEAAADMRARLVALKERIASAAGGAIPCEIGLSFDEVELARSVLRSMAHGTGRDLLGLNRSCEIDVHELERRYVLPLEKAHEERARALSRGGDDGTGMPNMDVAGLVRDLMGSYGGEAGKAKRRQQVAAALISEFDLNSTPFDIKAGKVHLTIRVSRDSYTKNEYCYYSQEHIGQAMAALRGMFEALGEPTPQAIRFDARRCGPGGSLDSGEIRVRFMVEKVQISLSARLAERMRAFIGENAPQ